MFDDIDLRVVNALMLENSEIFKHYLVDLSKEPHPDPTKAAEAKNIFRKYGHPSPFECFLADYRKYCQDKKSKESTVQTVNEPEIEVSIALPDSPDVEGRAFDLEPKRKIHVLPPFRKKRRRKEGFDVAQFLLRKKRSEEVTRLKFLADEDIQENVSRITEKEKVDLLIEGVFRNISNQIELLNQTCGYRILEVYYEESG